MSPHPVIVWFRDDLRVADHPALTAAMASGRPTVAFYVLDEVSPGVRPLGAAARWWLDRSLAAHTEALAELGVPLVLRRGPAAIVIGDVVAACGAEAVYWNRRYGGAEVAIDRDLKADLKASGIEARSFHADLLFEPPTVRTGSGGSYRVFTAFWRACLAGPAPRPPLPRPPHLAVPTTPVDGD
ncbi:MAG: deoxyribodipyrimidine photo-lyase, partial [Phyllobacteriaceae bacterium]|nr:deoxyribodipyrimidine photo-lyase [Phyllobacteriaceae bacterium]